MRRPLSHDRKRFATTPEENTRKTRVTYDYSGLLCYETKTCYKDVESHCTCRQGVCALLTAVPFHGGPSRRAVRHVSCQGERTRFSSRKNIVTIFTTFNLTTLVETDLYTHPPRPPLVRQHPMVRNQDQLGRGDLSRHATADELQRRSFPIFHKLQSPLADPFTSHTQNHHTTRRLLLQEIVNDR